MQLRVGDPLLFFVPVILGVPVWEGFTCERTGCAHSSLCEAKLCRDQGD